MSNQKPFYPMVPATEPPQAPFYPQVQQQPPPQLHHDRRIPPSPDYAGVECDNCGGYIDPGDEAIELFIGIAGRNIQTGLPSVIPPHNAMGKTVVVHKRSCLVEYACSEVDPDSADETLFEMANELATEMFQSMRDESEEAGLARRLADPGA